MTKFKGFETKEDAENCVKKDGGVLCGKEDDEESGDYVACVALGGLDKDKYPYCVIWKGV